MTVIVIRAPVHSTTNSPPVPTATAAAGERERSSSMPIGCLRAPYTVSGSAMHDERTSPPPPRRDRKVRDTAYGGTTGRRVIPRRRCAHLIHRAPERVTSHRTRTFPCPVRGLQCERIALHDLIIWCSRAT